LNPTRVNQEKKIAANGLSIYRSGSYAVAEK